MALDLPEFTQSEAEENRLPGNLTLELLMSI